MSQPNPVDTFLQEAEDLLEQIEQIALGLDEAPGDGEAVGHLFRAFHTIKGSGAMFGFDAVAGFTHHVETALDRVRDGLLPVSRELTELILAARDHIKVLLAGPQSGAGEDPAGDSIVAALKALCGAGNETAAAAAPRGAEHEHDGSRPQTHWRIRSIPTPM
jgi:two-component system, chemotaxis family, sensor kinase CheA